MLSGIIRHVPAAMAAVALLGAAAGLPVDISTADPGQDQKFFDLLGQKQIPPVDNANSLIETAHKACAKLDGGMSVGDLVELIRNNGYNENPLTRLNPADQITRTINQFVIASVQAYCPYDSGKIASITAYRTTPPGDATYRVTGYGHKASRGLMLASLVGPVPDGEIAPTKPLPVPAQPPPSPEQLAPAPQQPPPPPKRVQQAPQRQQQVQPPPQEAPPPPQEAPPQEAPPAQEPPPQEAPPAQAPAPAPAPVAPAPEPVSPAPPPAAPPGHIRLAP